jgi:hypothetical protein
MKKAWCRSRDSTINAEQPRPVLVPRNAEWIRERLVTLGLDAVPLAISAVILGLDAVPLGLDLVPLAIDAVPLGLYLVPLAIVAVHLAIDAVILAIDAVIQCVRASCLPRERLFQKGSLAKPQWLPARLIVVPLLDFVLLASSPCPSRLVRLLEIVSR